MGSELTLMKSFPGACGLHHRPYCSDTSSAATQLNSCKHSETLYLLTLPLKAIIIKSVQSPVQKVQDIIIKIYGTIYPDTDLRDTLSITDCTYVFHTSACSRPPASHWLRHLPAILIISFSLSQKPSPAQVFPRSTMVSLSELNGWTHVPAEEE